MVYYISFISLISPRGDEFRLILNCRNMNKIFYLHLSTVLGAVFPLGSIIFPYISWKAQARLGDKDVNETLRKQCLNIINFQLLVFILFIISPTLIWYNIIVGFKETAEWNYSLLALPLLLYWGCTVIYPLFVLLMIKCSNNLKLYYPKIHLLGR